MSTNFYLHRDFCKCCGKPKEILHIGKRSAGWKFLFEYRNELREYRDLDSFLDTGVIYNEYDRQLSKQDFLSIIESFQNYKPRDLQYNPEIFISKYNDEEYEFCTVEFS